MIKYLLLLAIAENRYSELVAWLKDANEKAPKELEKAIKNLQR